MSRKFEYVSRLNQGYGLPCRATEKSAGYDFICQERQVIPPHEIVIIKTGIKVVLPDREYLELCNRSSNPMKRGLILINGVGVIDGDYYNNKDNEGEIGFQFYNKGDKEVVFTPGEKIGQGIFKKFEITDDDKASGVRTGDRKSVV